jgi:uncharacterized protein YabN with tetrapyrrole methylase and pyrophosphatase domain
MSNNSSLNNLITADNAACDFGFEWPDADMIIEQAISECYEVKQALERQESKAKIQEEIGDLLHTAVSLCLFAGFDVDETIDKSAQKLSLRINTLKELAKARSLTTLKDETIMLKLQLWDEVKSKLGQN